MTARLRPTTVEQGGRAKAYRPLALDVRREALREGLAAYERGEYFLAHEILEPAWMGTDDPTERDLHQGLIKLSAAFVHALRGNPLGVEKNLRGARERLTTAVAAGRVEGLDVPAILRDVDERLAGLQATEIDPNAATVRRRPLGIEPVPISRLARRR